MNSYTKVSFNEAWRDFLILRGILYEVRINFSLDANHKISDVNHITSLVRKNFDGEEYFCDESSANIPLCYSKNLVLPEIQKKIVEPFFVEQLTRTSKIASPTYLGRRKKMVQKIEAQLGCAIRTEVCKLISGEQYWEVLFSLHQILKHRLRKMLMYKSMLEPSTKEILFDERKETICKQIPRFKHLIDIAFLTGAIEGSTRAKLEKFNSDRNDLAHHLFKKKIPPNKLKKLCFRGLKLMDTLEHLFSKIIQKPRFIKMRRFDVVATKNQKDSLS